MLFLESITLFAKVLSFRAPSLASIGFHIMKQPVEVSFYTNIMITDRL